MMPVGSQRRTQLGYLLLSKGFRLNLEGHEGAGVEQPVVSALGTCVNGVARKKRRMLFGNFRETVEEMELRLGVLKCW